MRVRGTRQRQWVCWQALRRRELGGKKVAVLALKAKSICKLRQMERQHSVSLSNMTVQCPGAIQCCSIVRAMNAKHRYLRQKELLLHGIQFTSIGMCFLVGHCWPRPRPSSRKCRRHSLKTLPAMSICPNILSGHGSLPLPTIRSIGKMAKSFEMFGIRKNDCRSN